MLLLDKIEIKLDKITLLNCHLLLLYYYFLLNTTTNLV